MSNKTFSVQMTGDDKLIADLKKKANLNEVSNIVKNNTVELQGRTARKAGSTYTKGYSTGATKRAIALDISKLEGTVGLTMEYNGYTELGTRYMAPEPILIPSLNVQQRIFLSDLKKAVGG